MKNTPEKTKSSVFVRTLAVVRPVASCVDQPVVVPVSSVLVLHCPGVHKLPPALEVERVLGLIKVDAVFLTINLFLDSAQSNLSPLVSTCTVLHQTTNEMVCSSHSRLFYSWCMFTRLGLLPLDCLVQSTTTFSMFQGSRHTKTSIRFLTDYSESSWSCHSIERHTWSLLQNENHSTLLLPSFPLSHTLSLFYTKADTHDSVVYNLWKIMSLVSW